MSRRYIKIYVNEKSVSVSSDDNLEDLTARIKPDADVLIINGFPAQPQHKFRAGDRVTMIKKGEVPGSDALEALLTARHTPGVHERIKKASVGIAGLGGLGSAAAVALARMGIGSLILADYDVVEPSNLNRQQYFLRHIGMTKCAAMEGILREINPYVRIEAFQTRLTPQNIPRIFARVDVILECFDKAEEKAMLLETAAEVFPETYVIGASGVAGYGESNRILTRKWGNKIFIIGDLVSAAEPGRGLMAPRVGIAALHQANLTVALIMDPEKAVSEISEIFD